jgi:hypothetical protein
MADERDPKVSQRYRELEAEEPPRELDQTILAAAHRAADRAHAPLLAPAGRHRWYFAFGAAAVLMLAVAVTIHVDRQRPDPESLSDAQAPAPREEEPKPAAEPEAFPDLERVREAEKARELMRPDRAPTAPMPAEERAKREAQSRLESQSAPAAAAPAVRPMMSSRVAGTAEPPQRWLERILELRKQGKHEEAEKQLAEFRRSYPDYRISEEMLRKIEKK